MTKAQFRHLMDLSLRQTQEIERLREALTHILWIKDCGVDGVDENGVFRNWPEKERDAMYRVAKDAIEKIISRSDSAKGEAK